MCHSFSFVISHVVFVPRARLLPVHAVSYAAEQLRSGLDATKHTHRSIPGRTEPPCRSLIHLPRYGVGTDNLHGRLPCIMATKVPKYAQSSSLFVPHITQTLVLASTLSVLRCSNLSRTRLHGEFRVDAVPSSVGSSVSHRWHFSISLAW
ncbi:hypothetical protein PSPO01_00319 [Paraphaeosphaeria sporulosa]